MYLFTDTYRVAAKNSLVGVRQHSFGAALLRGTGDALAGRCAR